MSYSWRLGQEEIQNQLIRINILVSIAQFQAGKMIRIEPRTWPVMTSTFNPIVNKWGRAVENNFLHFGIISLMSVCHWIYLTITMTMDGALPVLDTIGITY